MADISNTASGKIILGAISAAEAEWRRKIVQFISDQIPHRLSVVQHCVLRLRLQPEKLTFVEIGNLIGHTPSNTNLKFRTAIWRLERWVCIKLYKRDLFYDLKLIEEIREAVMLIPMPEIPKPLISIEERRILRSKARVKKLFRLKREEAQRKRFMAAQVERNRLHERISSMMFAKLKKANYPDYRITKRL